MQCFEVKLEQASISGILAMYTFPLGELLYKNKGWGAPRKFRK